MDDQLLIGRILDDEGLVGDLEGDAAETLIVWLTSRARRIAGQAKSESGARAEVEALCQRGRELAANAARQSDPAAALNALLTREA